MVIGGPSLHPKAYLLTPGRPDFLSWRLPSHPELALVAAAEDAEQDEEEVDEVEVEAQCQQQRVVVACPLGLDPPEVEERQPDEHDPEEEAERQLADGEVEDQRREADDDTNE